MTEDRRGEHSWLAAISTVVADHMTTRRIYSVLTTTGSMLMFRVILEAGNMGTSAAYTVQSCNVYTVHVLQCY